VGFYKNKLRNYQDEEELDNDRWEFEFIRKIGDAMIGKMDAFVWRHLIFFIFKQLKIERELYRFYLKYIHFI